MMRRRRSSPAAVVEPMRGPVRACCMCRQRQSADALLRFAWVESDLRFVRAAGLVLDESLPARTEHGVVEDPLRAGPSTGGTLATAHRNDDDTPPSGMGDRVQANSLGRESSPSTGRKLPNCASNAARAGEGVRAMSVCPTPHCLGNWLRKMAGHRGLHPGELRVQLPSDGQLLRWLQQTLAERWQRRTAGLERRRIDTAQDPVLLRLHNLGEELQRSTPVRAQKRPRNAGIPAKPGAVRPQSVRP